MLYMTHYSLLIPYRPRTFTAGAHGFGYSSHASVALDGWLLQTCDLKLRAHVSAICRRITVMHGFDLRWRAGPFVSTEPDHGLGRWDRKGRELIQASKATPPRVHN